MRTELRELHQTPGVTSVYVTPGQIDAMTMADRIILRDGTVEQQGHPLELFDRPANTFVASFIRSPVMILLEETAGNGRFAIGDGLILPFAP